MSIVEIRHTTQLGSHLLVEFCIQQGICSAQHPLQYDTPPPQSPLPHLLQEMASRWCHRSVCLELKIEVYGMAIFLTCLTVGPIQLFISFY